MAVAGGRGDAQDSPGLRGPGGGTFFAGSTIVSMATNFQPELIYTKYPRDDSVGPGTTWELSVGVALQSAASTINVTLSLDPEAPNADIQILDDTADFVPQDGLYHNYDPSARFEIAYTGTLEPFVGPVDFLLEPDGMAQIPLSVHLNVTDQPGFPIQLLISTGANAPLGDITGDGNMEILFPGLLVGVEGLQALDHAGMLLSGWPLASDDPDIVDEVFSIPAIVDLDGDGPAEVIVVGWALRDVPAERASAGSEISTTLYAVEGSGAVRWQVMDDLPLGSPAVADIDGDAGLDIVVGAGTNLKRFDIDGTPLNEWQVEAPNDVHVAVPVLADVDGNAANGLEIIACTPVFGPPNFAQVYVWNNDGSLHSPAWPKALDACRAPVVVDLDLDPSNGREILMAFDHENPPVDPDNGFLNTFSVFAWHVDGSDVAGWPHHFMRDPNAPFPDDRIIAPGSAGDVDGDGDVEFVIGTYGQGDPLNGNLFLFHHDGTLDANWPRWAGTAQVPSPAGGMALADLDGDGPLEIVTASFRGVYVFRADGGLFEGFPKLTVDNFAQPMVADIDDDGMLEILELSLVDGLHVWKMLTPSPDPRPWPVFRQNSMRTGSVIQGQAAGVPAAAAAGLITTLFLLVCAGAFIIRRSRTRVAGPSRPAHCTAQWSVRAAAERSFRN